ncbi:MAG: anthrone oxygenase family protein [Planctomycetota bacterium]
MILFQLALIAATFLCTLVAGFLFAFAVVVMPGIKQLGDAEYLRAFQVMDRIIQDNQPLFLTVWVGSAVALFAAAVIGPQDSGSGDRMVLIAALVMYLAGVQLPTITINIPLNNKLQALDIANLAGPQLRAARADFESRWNRWNVRRTCVSCAVSLVLIIFVSLR